MGRAPGGVDPQPERHSAGRASDGDLVEEGQGDLIQAHIGVQEEEQGGQSCVRPRKQLNAAPPSGADHPRPRRSSEIGRGVQAAAVHDDHLVTGPQSAEVGQQQADRRFLVQHGHDHAEQRGALRYGYRSTAV